MRWFPLLSRIPGTREWRVWRQTNRWLNRAGRVLAEAFPGSPDPPTPPRDLRALLLAVESMEAILTGVQRFADGGASLDEAWAVVGEHWPTPVC